MQETLALLKLLALGQQDMDAGRHEPVDVAFDRVLASKREAAKPAGHRDPVQRASARITGAGKPGAKPRVKSAAKAAA